MENILLPTISKTISRIAIFVYSGIIGSAIFPAACAAQNSAENMVDVSQCVGILDEGQRLACFDQLTAHLQHQSSEDQLPIVDSLARQPSATLTEQSENGPAIDRNFAETDDVDEFGRPPQSPRLMASDNGAVELFDRVASLRKRAPNLWAITLESGQVWLQSNSQFFHLREGDEVKVYPSRLGGSFRLKRVDTNGFIQVERVE
jgi:hypothetical protein